MRALRITIHESGKLVFSGEFDTVADCFHDTIPFIMRRYPLKIVKDLMRPAMDC